MTQRSIEEAEEAMALELMRFIEDAVSQILREEEEDGFFDWVRAEAPRRLPGVFADLPNEQAGRAITFDLGRAIWNQVPLPGAGYRPRPIPRPERNEPCPCGSGLKHKKCCGAVAGGRIELPFQAEDAWALVLGRTPTAEVAQLSSDRRVPRALLAGIAERLNSFDTQERALALLAPVFAEPQLLDERDAPAFDSLFEAYDTLGLFESKELMIAQLTSGLRPALRPVLWESLAQSFLALGESERAWDAAEKLRGVDPESPILGWVEVILLLGDDRLPEASERAKKALDLHPSRPGLTQEALELLEETVENPVASRRRLLLDDLLPAVERLEKIVAAIAGRPVRSYAVRTEGEAPGTGRLLSPEGIYAVEDGWIDASFAAEADEEEGEEDEDLAEEWEEDDDDEAAALEAELEASEEKEEDDDDLEEDDEDEDEDDLWDEDDEDDEDHDHDDEDIEAMWHPAATDNWLTFLEQTPEAFDSLLVLSDLVDRVGGLAADRDLSLRESIIAPLAARGVAILDASLAGTPEVIFPVVLEENLPGLELLAWSAEFAGEPARVIAILERLLNLDPEDYLVVRGDLATAYLQAGEPQKVLDLDIRFPDREEALLVFARVIALRQLGRKEDSNEALDEALENFPMTATALAVSSSQFPDAFLAMWKNDEELWKELNERLNEEEKGEAEEILF